MRRSHSESARPALLIWTVFFVRIFSFRGLHFFLTISGVGFITIFITYYHYDPLNGLNYGYILILATNHTR